MDDGAIEFTISGGGYSYRAYDPSGHLATFANAIGKGNEVVDEAMPRLIFTVAPSAETLRSLEQTPLASYEARPPATYRSDGVQVNLPRAYVRAVEVVISLPDLVDVAAKAMNLPPRFSNLARMSAETAQEVTSALVGSGSYISNPVVGLGQRESMVQFDIHNWQTKKESPTAYKGGEIVATTEATWRLPADEHGGPASLQVHPINVGIRFALPPLQLSTTEATRRGKALAFTVNRAERTYAHPDASKWLADWYAGEATLKADVKDVAPIVAADVAAEVAAIARSLEPQLDIVENSTVKERGLGG